MQRGCGAGCVSYPADRRPVGYPLRDAPDAPQRGGDHRVLKVSRTIADLEDVDVIQMHYLAEALQHRAWVLDL